MNRWHDHCISSKSYSRTSQKLQLIFKIEEQIIRENLRNVQYRDTGNSEHTRQRTKSNKAMKKKKNQDAYIHNTANYMKQGDQYRPHHKRRCESKCLWRVSMSCLLQDIHQWTRLKSNLYWTSENTFITCTYEIIQNFLRLETKSNVRCSRRARNEF